MSNVWKLPTGYLLHFITVRGMFTDVFGNVMIDLQVREAHSRVFHIRELGG